MIFNMKASSTMLAVAVLFLLGPLIGCLGWGDLFGEKLVIAGDYFLMEGERNTTDDLYLFPGDNTGSVAGPLNRVGWNKQYVILTAANCPEWCVIAVREHKQFKITDIQRTQDPRFKQIVIGSASEAWQRAKTQNSN
jgi:hypothetical protein